jgi:transposase
MAQNFLPCDREQVFLMPPNLREWLPENHLAWFVIDAVDAMDLSAFYAAYRQDGHGRAAYEPSMMVALSSAARSTPNASNRLACTRRQERAARPPEGLWWTSRDAFGPGDR